MLIKLPIIANNKIVYIIFKLVKYDNYLILSVLNNKNYNNDNLVGTQLLPKLISDDKTTNNLISSLTVSQSVSHSENNTTLLSQDNTIKNDTIGLSEEKNLLKVVCVSNINGIDNINLYFPLKLHIINNLVFTNNFLNINLVSTMINNIDFFYNLNNILISKYELSFLKMNHYKKYELDIIKIINNEYKILVNEKNEKNFNNYVKNFWDITNLLLNLSVFMIYNDFNIKKNKIKIPKIVYQLVNDIKKYKFSIYSSNDYTITDHLKYHNNEELIILDLEKEKKYYLIIKKKKILLKIRTIINNLIVIYDSVHNNDLTYSTIDFYNYKWYIYPPDFNVNIMLLYYKLINSKEVYNIIISKYNTSIINNNYDNIYNYYINKPIKSYLSCFMISDLEILKSNSFTLEFFIEICDKYKENYLLILEILFSNYTFPIRYNKLEIETTFDYILYISILNINKILINDKNKSYLNNEINNIIPIKIKTLYFNIIKSLQIIIEGKYSINNIKYLHDNMHKQFIKTFFYEKSNTIILLENMVDKDTIDKIKLDLQISFLLTDIINKINWGNIQKRLDLLKILLEYNDYIFFYDKLNKNIFSESFDNKIKSIIQNPFDMFKYLNTEEEIIKWIYFLENRCINLYINPISISCNELTNIGKLIYLLINIKEQSLKDKTYVDFINFCSNNIKLILDNNRVNLKIKEYFNFLNCNLNLGIIAKQLNIKKNKIMNENYEMSNDISNELINIKNQLLEMTKKYIKYKKKYYTIKLGTN